MPRDPWEPAFFCLLVPSSRGRPRWSGKGRPTAWHTTAACLFVCLVACVVLLAGSVPAALGGTGRAVCLCAPVGTPRRCRSWGMAASASCHLAMGHARKRPQRHCCAQRRAHLLDESQSPLLTATSRWKPMHTIAAETYLPHETAQQAVRAHCARTCPCRCPEDFEATVDVTVATACAPARRSEPVPMAVRYLQVGGGRGF